MWKAIGALVMLTVGYLGAAVTEHMAAPHCPEEDSCQVDYTHGTWVITEVQP